MADSPGYGLRPAVVVARGEDTCTVVAGGTQFEAAYAPFFPSPRTERVAPGHLVALTGGLIVWRWFDAVVVNATDELVRLWEPVHGEVMAKRRNPSSVLVPGGRAYLSAGLPGAEWWVEGPASGRSEDAEVDMRAVEAFLGEHGLTTGLGESSR